MSRFFIPLIVLAAMAPVAGAIRRRGRRGNSVVTIRPLRIPTLALASSSPSPSGPARESDVVVTLNAPEPFEPDVYPRRRRRRRARRVVGAAGDGRSGRRAPVGAGLLL